jgi:hypothetical protein
VGLTEKADLENMLAAFILCGVMVVEGCWDNAVAKCRDLGAFQSSPLGVTQMETC